MTPQGSESETPIWLEVPRSAYVHVPFCTQRCGYCNFALITGREDLVGSYLEALQCELEKQTEPWPERLPLETLFLGGGTPTYLQARQRQELVDTLHRYFDLSGLHEFSVESNPNDLTTESVADWRRLGATRFSLGVQSFQEHKLQTLERTHRAEDVFAASQAVHDSGAELSLDLIFAAPGESESDWKNDLQQAIDCRPDHISTYQLTFEKGTQFWNRLQHGVLQEVEDGEALERYQMAIQFLTANGFQHYEVSNFAKPGRESRHNCVYWSGRPYLAFGPAAARYIAGQRLVNHASTTTYLRRALQTGDATVEVEPYDPELRAREYFVFGMRMLRGVSPEAFQRDTGRQLLPLCGDQISEDVRHGWMVWDDSTLKLTEAGLAVSDGLWPKYL